MRAHLLCLVLSVAPRALPGQWVPQSTGTESEFRGLHAVNSRVVWAAGRGGVVTRTRDGGATWRTDTIPGARSLFLIAIRALDARRAWVLGTAFSGESAARIFRTDDAGATWRLQYENTTKGIFFDGMAFWDAKHGLAFGDPLDGRMVMVATGDGGAHWKEVPPGRIPAALPGEAAFAASGTAIAARGGREAWIATGGGARARVFHTADRGTTWEVFDTPASGGPAKGIFGLAIGDGGRGVAVGGDYRERDASAENLLLTEDGGRTWRLAGSTDLTGVQYGVATAGKRTFVSAGPAGSAVSRDGGGSWHRLDGPGFNTVSCAATLCWAAGTDGRIARLTWPR